jgi:hypothetical protein
LSFSVIFFSFSGRLLKDQFDDTAQNLVDRTDEHRQEKRRDARSSFPSEIFSVSRPSAHSFRIADPVASATDVAVDMAGPAGIEPATPGFGDRCSTY